MVASDSRIASEVGVSVLKRGGNAVDAAVAVALALAVVYPEAGNLGGGGFMLMRLGDGRTAAIDYREMAPAAAHRNLFLDAKGDLVQGEGSSTRGYRASGVPGTVAGLSLALKKYGSGRLTWSQLVEPARKLAAEGFTLTHSLAKTFRDNSKEMMQYPESRRVFLKDGKFFAEGEVFRQPELGRHARALAGARPARVLRGADRATHRRRHEEERRPDDGGGLARLRAARARAAALDLPRPRSDLDAAAFVGRRRADRDAEHPRRLRPRADGLVFLRDVPRDDRGDAPRLRRPRRVPRRPRPREGARRRSHRQELRGAHARHDQPGARLDERGDQRRAARGQRAVRDDALLGRGRRRQRRRQHLHDQRPLRLGRDGEGDGRAAERRDGRLHGAARHAEPLGRDSGRAEPRRAAQAPALLDDADHRHAQGRHASGSRSARAAARASSTPCCKSSSTSWTST